MKAVVLAGGYATRLWPITKHRPKMFLPVGETTVIDRIFDQLERDDRVETVYVSTNERFAGDFEEYLDESAFEKPVLSVEETSEEDEKFGVVGALAQLVDREGVDDDLLESFADAHALQLGDTLPVVINGTLRDLRIVGIAMSPEATLPSASTAKPAARSTAGWSPAARCWRRKWPPMSFTPRANG